MCDFETDNNKSIWGGPSYAWVHGYHYDWNNATDFLKEGGLSSPAVLRKHT